MVYCSQISDLIAAINFNADQTLVGTAMNMLATAAATVFVKVINMAENPNNVASTIQYISQKKAFSIVKIAGFGFLALAVMIFGQWKPNLIALAALLFGLFRALSNVYAGFDFLTVLNIPGIYYKMLPYIDSRRSWT